MGIYVKFYHDHSRNMVMSRGPGCKFRNFYFSPNSTLNFRKNYQIWGKLAQEQKVTGKKQNLGWKTPPPPSAYKVNVFYLKRGEIFLEVNDFSSC